MPGVTRRFLEADRRSRVGSYLIKSSERYEGLPIWRVLKVIKAILYFIHWGTGSQWRDLKRDFVLYWNLVLLQITLVKEFWTIWRQSVDVDGRP